MGEMNFKEIYQLFDELCINLAGKNNSECCGMHRNRSASLHGLSFVLISSSSSLFCTEGKALKRVSQYISTNPNTLSKNLPFDESTLIKNISSQLSVSKTPNDVSLFNSCYEQLATCVSNLVLRCLGRTCVCVCVWGARVRSICERNNNGRI